MANWYGSARSNYFTVKDVLAFKEWAKRRHIEVWEADGRVGICPADAGDDGGWPSYDPETDEDFDLFGELQEHMLEDEVAILLEVGAEKLRYLTYYAIAVHAGDGEILRHSTSTFYKALEDRGLTFTLPEY